MARIIILFALLTVGSVLVRKLIEQWRAHQNQTYRPSPRKPDSAKSDGTTFIMSRNDLRGIRDSFSSEAIDPDRALMRCPSCQAMYHADSVVNLRRENDGRCLGCGNDTLDSVHVSD